MRTPHVASGGRYPVLRALAIIYIVMAAVAVISGLVAAGWALVAAPWDLGNRIMLALLALSGSFFLVVGSLVIAEIIKLAIDIESNTRMAAMGYSGNENMPLSESPSRSSRLRELDEETAEGALIRGH